MDSPEDSSQETDCLGNTIHFVFTKLFLHKLWCVFWIVIPRKMSLCEKWFPLYTPAWLSLQRFVRKSSDCPLEKLVWKYSFTVCDTLPLSRFAMCAINQEKIYNVVAKEKSYICRVDKLECSNKPPLLRHAQRCVLMGKRKCFSHFAERSRIRDQIMPCTRSMEKKRRPVLNWQFTDD